MIVTRKRYSAKRKLDVAIVAAQGEKTVNEIASKFKVHPNQVTLWKKTLLEMGIELFNQKKSTSAATETLVSQLYEEVGRLKFELDWLKKKAAKFD